MQQAAKPSKSYKSYLLEIPMLALVGVILFYGAFWQRYNIPNPNTKYYTDVAKYECYAYGFWQGTPGLTQFPSIQCGFLEKYSSPQPLHTLPREYPLLVLVPFSLPLLVPASYYSVAFIFLMVVLVGVIYFVLKGTRSISAALAFLVYLVLGCWSTAGGRFDLIPSMFTLFAVIAAEKKYWRWAFAWLAIATMLKFYPVILVPVFLIAQQKDERSAWASWRRIQPLAIFTFICAALTLLSLALSVDGTLAPLSYFKDRPIQIESVSASVVWIWTQIRHAKLGVVYSFGSYNIVSVYSGGVSLGGTILLVIGLAYTWWLQLRGKITLPFSTLLTLLVVMITGKVFSPQYLLWIAPLLAYVGQANWRWLLGWGIVGVITTYIYPFLYVSVYLLYPQVLQAGFIRNVIMVLFSLTLFIYVSFRFSTRKAVESSGKPTVHDEKYA